MQTVPGNAERSFRQWASSCASLEMTEQAHKTTTATRLAPVQLVIFVHHLAQVMAPQVTHQSGLWTRQRVMPRLVRKSSCPQALSKAHQGGSGGQTKSSRKPQKVSRHRSSLTTSSNGANHISITGILLFPSYTPRHYWTTSAKSCREAYVLQRYPP